MTIKEAVEEYEFATKHQTQKTRTWKFNKLKFFIEWCEQNSIDEIKGLRNSHVRRFLDEMSHRQGRSKRGATTQTKDISSFTLRGYAETVKGFLTWCKEDGLIDTPVVVKLFKTEDKIIEIFSEQQINALFEVCKKEYNERLAYRDRAILSILFDTGIRVSELCGLTLDKLSLDGYIRVMGKGRKEREIGLGHKSLASVRRYVTRFRGRHEGEDHVFLNRNNEPMTPNGVEQMFIRLCEWARIRDIRCSAHTCRHTFAVNYLLRTGDIYMLSRILGHESVKVTEMYLKAIKQKEVRQSSFSLLDDLDKK